MQTTNTDRAGAFQARREFGSRHKSTVDNLPAGSRRILTKGEELFAEGDSASFFYKVISGTIRTSTLLSDARRQIDSFLFAEDIFGFEAGRKHTFTAEALEDGIVVAFRQSYFRSLLDDCPTLADELMMATVASLHRARNHMLLLGRRDARERIAIFLLDLSGRLKTDRFDLPMQRTDIADHLGMTRETVSRTFTRLSREGLIRLESFDQVFLHDKRGLRRLIIAERI
jgi:CRP/FNR family nitrogen fixation transcriptional regulator